MKEFIPNKLIMACGSHEANIRTYNKYTCDNGIFYVAIQDNAADNIYFWDHDNNDGFAGQTIKFTLDDGTIEKRKGPWHTNSSALLSHTGIDITDKHLTYIVIAKNREFITPGYYDKYCLYG